MAKDNPSIARIRKQQPKVIPSSLAPSARHPEVLVVGCIDARKNLHDLGFGEDDTLMLRNIAATIVKNNGSAESTDQAKALKEAIDSGVEHIVVMGHTSCGGLEEACTCAHEKELPAVHKHLEQYKGIREELFQKYCHGNPDALPTHIHSMEREMGEAAVCLSLDNLRSYDFVREAEAAGRLQLHAWVMNTANETIREHLSTNDGGDEPKPEIPNFGPMRAPEHDDLESIIKKIRRQQQIRQNPKNKEIPDDTPPPAHNPSMLVISEMAAPINPQNLDIHPGDALIYRAHDPCNVPVDSQKAAIEFAVMKGVGDVAVMLPFEDDITRILQEKALQKAAKTLKPDNQALADKGVRTHFWLIDKETRRIHEMDPVTETFTAMATSNSPTLPR